MKYKLKLLFDNGKEPLIGVAVSKKPSPELIETSKQLFGAVSHEIIEFVEPATSMKRYYFKIDLGYRIVEKFADSNSKATAITMVVNSFAPEKQEKIKSITNYAQAELNA